jgi:hypothetical protein
MCTKYLLTCVIQISALSVDSVIVLLFESMVATMPYFASVSKMLLSDILMDSCGETTESFQVSLFDVVVVLIGFSMPACIAQTKEVMQSWLSCRQFPIEYLIAIMERRTTHEV